MNYKICVHFIFYQAGREGREKFGQRTQRMNPHASTTNREKRKGKTFMMMKHKIRDKKTKRSFQDKQVSQAVLAPI